MEVEEKEKVEDASPTILDPNCNSFGIHDVHKSLPLDWTKDMWRLVDPTLIIPNNEVCITSDEIPAETGQKAKVNYYNNEITDHHEYQSFGPLDTSVKSRSRVKILTENKDRNAEVKNCTMVEQNIKKMDTLDGNKFEYHGVKKSH